MDINEVSPPGWHGTVRAMKTHKEPKKDIDNPYALAWHMKKKGDKPHYKDQPTSKKGKPKKKKKYKEKDTDKKSESFSFQQYLENRDPDLYSELFGESKKPSAGLSKKKKSEVAKKASQGKDIGKKGKNFDKVAKKAKEGGADDPEAVAAAAMWKNIKRKG